MQTKDKNGAAEQSPVRTPWMEDASEEGIQLDLIELFYRLVERLNYIVTAAIVGALLAGAITIVGITPKYTATSKLYIMNSGETAIDLSDLQMGTYLALDYMEVFKNWHVHERVIQALNLPYSYEEITGMLSVANPADTRILYINVTADSADEAKQIADTYAAVAREFIAATMDTKEPSLFEEALLPTHPSSPNLPMNILTGFAVGLLGMCAVIIVCFLIDDRIRSAADVEKYLDLPVLGVLSVQEDRPANSKRPKKEGVHA